MARFIPISILASLALASGCATVAPAEIDPLEDTAETMFGQVEFELQLNDIILLNPYLEKDSPDVDAFDVARLDLMAAAELLVDYSVDLIDVARVDAGRESVPIVVSQIRDLDSSLRNLSLIGPRLNGVDIEAALANAAEKDDLTRALRAATPVTSAIAEALRDAIDEVNSLFDRAVEETYGKITEENRSFMAYADNLIARRDELLQKLLLLDDARKGDADSWQKLLAEDEDLGQQMGSDLAMTHTSIDRAESILVARLAKIMEIWGYLEPTWELYQETLRELYTTDANVRTILKIAQYIIDDWEKAQRQMAKGRPAGFVRVTKDLAYLALRRAAR